MAFPTPQPSNPSPVSLSGTPASWPPCNPGPVRSLRGTRCPGRPGRAIVQPQL